MQILTLGNDLSTYNKTDKTKRSILGTVFLLKCTRPIVYACEAYTYDKVSAYVHLNGSELISEHSGCRVWRRTEVIEMSNAIHVPRED